MYQVWSDSSNTQNNDRNVGYVKAKKWINTFNSYNKYLEKKQKPLFTPTTVMEIGNYNYVFVIHEAKINMKGHVVFKVSTQEINLSEKKMLKLPYGHHDGVRFDIDVMPYLPPQRRPPRPPMPPINGEEDYMTILNGP